MLWSDLIRDSRAWDPWREFEQVNRRVSEVAASFSADTFPGINVWTNGNGATVTTEVPGIDPSSMDISVVGRTLTLGGSRAADNSAEEESYHRRERWAGRFTRSVELPFLIDAGKVEAKFSRGVLHITLPRAEEDKPKKIAVKTV